MQSGQIRKAISGYYYIYSEGTTYQTRGRGVFRIQAITPLVGDKVLFESENLTDGVLMDILPRKNELVRPPVANVDRAIIVMSAVEPAFSEQLLDRYLVILESLDMEAVIYISKTDLLKKEQWEKLKHFQSLYQEIGYHFLLPDPSEKKTTLNELRSLFKGELVVFMGQSGAGKSTLLNMLAPDLKLETGEISTSLGRGKHTTRHVELFPLDGGLIADTPGFSSLEFDSIEKEELPNLFPEFEAIADQCRFTGCFHRHEPGCAVKQAVKKGTIPSFRYEDYLQFLKEIEDRKPDYRKKEKK